jgi:lipoate-protein ligase A
MILKDVSFPTPTENILFDDVLLQMAEKGQIGDVLRFWESETMFVVLGRICKEEDDLKIAKLKEDHIPVVRRSSGGGTVLQGQGCFNYALILSKENDVCLNDIGKSYEYILTRVTKALALSGVDARFLPISDIALAKNQNKFSGNAQKRGKKYILHHGTVLYDFNLENIEKYLKIPKSIPEYRKDRSHLDFVTNIDVSLDKLKENFKNVFNISEECSRLSLEEQEYLMHMLKTREVIVEV